MNIYTYDNIPVMQDSDDIIEYDMINNNQVLTSSGGANFRLKFIGLSRSATCNLSCTGNDKRTRHMKTFKMI